jgi:hypothetical protein
MNELKFLSRAIVEYYNDVFIIDICSLLLQEDKIRICLKRECLELVLNF